MHRHAGTPALSLAQYRKHEMPELQEGDHFSKQKCLSFETQPRHGGALSRLQPEDQN